MSWTLTRKVLKLQATSLVSYAGGALLYSLMAVVLFERVIAPHANFIQQYIRLFPKGFLRAFNAGGDYTTFGGFVAAEYLGFMWVVILVAFLVSFTSGALARELEQGTLELLLAYPLSRARVFNSKVLALMIGLALIVSATLVGLWIGAASQHAAVAGGSFWAMAVLGVAFGLAIAGYGFLFSAAASERAVAAAAAAALTVLFYAMNFAAQTWDRLSGLGRFSIFHYYKPEDTINLARVDVFAILVLLGIAVFTTVAAGLIFRYRDLSP